MHKSSEQNMRALISRYYPNAEAARKTVLDIGACSLNGAYRRLFEPQQWGYTGLDVSAGPNVDVVAEDPYRWPLKNSSFDLAVSGQVLEHAEFFWLSLLEIRRILKPGGHLFLIVPSRGPQHRHPVDCWRFYPDSFAAMAKWTGMKLIWVNNPWLIDGDLDFQSMWEWGDCVGVLRSPEKPISEELSALQNAVINYLDTSSSVAGDANVLPVRTPRSRESYLSMTSILKFRFNKHFR